MGTGTRQIATWNDINSNKRKGYKIGVECVTKKDVNSIEGLTVTEAYDNKTVSSYYAGNPTTGACTITVGNYSTTPSDGTVSTVLSGNTLFGMTSSTRVYVNSSSNSSVNVVWGANGSISLTTAQDYMSNCLFYSNCTVNVGVQYTWIMQLECVLGHSSGPITSSTGCMLMGQNGIGRGVFDIAIIDRTNNTILRKYQSPFEDGTIIINESFSSPSSNICLCFVPLQYQMTGNILTDLGTTNQSIFWGYRLLTNTLSGQLSYYPTDTKLVQYKDVTRTSISFNFYYGIYNNKSSNAKLDSVAVYISTSSDPSSGTWTKIGSVDPGTVKSIKTGYISCTIPSSIDLSKTYYLKVTCGNTTYNQDWYTMWDNSANIKTVSGWTFRGSAKSMTISGGVVVNSNGAAVLNSTKYSGGYYGRTASVAALFKIQ